MKRIHHVQVAIPPGEEDTAREFCVGIIGFSEVEKPLALQTRGGAWFKIDDIEFHVGVESEFLPAHKAHPAFTWDGVDELADRLMSAGYTADWDNALGDQRHLYTSDLFGNRLEFVAD